MYLKDEEQELEALCRPYVDFAAADALTERTLHELFPA